MNHSMFFISSIQKIDFIFFSRLNKKYLKYCLNLKLISCNTGNKDNIDLWPLKNDLTSSAVSVVCNFAIQETKLLKVADPPIKTNHYLVQIDPN